jgi:AraC-like DNA-binding protein
MPLIVAMPIGPLILFYVRSLFRPLTNLEKKDWIHFCPVLLDLIPRIAGALYLTGLSLDWISNNEIASWVSFINGCDMFLDIPRWFSVSIYTMVAWREIKTMSLQKTELKTIRWASQVVLVFGIFQVIWLIHLVPYLIPTLSDELLRVVSWYPIYIPLAIMVYWLGINGYLIRFDARSEAAKSVSLPRSVIESTKEALLKSMEIDQLFKDPQLNLNRIVEHTGIHQKTISHVLNQQMGKSFNEFVNQYRIEAVKQKLLEGNRNFTITGIGLECGFNSQATFQRAFKYATGLTPTEYLSKAYKKSFEIDTQI